MGIFADLASFIVSNDSIITQQTHKIQHRLCFSKNSKNLK
jgi:hypothetical protein